MAKTTKAAETRPCDDCGKAVKLAEWERRDGVCGSCDRSAREGNENARRWHR